MTIALALLALMIVMLFSGLVFGALRDEIPVKALQSASILNRQGSRSANKYR